MEPLTKDELRRLKYLLAPGQGMVGHMTRAPHGMFDTLGLPTLEAWLSELLAISMKLNDFCEANPDMDDEWSQWVAEKDVDILCQIREFLYILKGIR